MSKGSLKKQRRYAQAQARKQAASQHIPHSCDVLVIGAGASGLICTLELASLVADKSLVLLEAKPSLGAPLLATGNGRCNYCHEPLDPRAYNHPLWMEQFFSAVGELWPQMTPSQVVRDYFAQLGLISTNHEGWLYPRSLVAASLRDVLLHKLETLPVTVGTMRAVVSIEKDASGYNVCYQERFREDEREASGWAAGTIRAQQVVVAAGGNTLASFNGLKLPLVPSEPVLCPVALRTDLFEPLDGHRARTRVRAYNPCSEVLFDEEGEVLLRTAEDRSLGILSGIVAYNLSRKVSAGDRVVLDFLPECTHDEVASLLCREGAYDPARLDGALDPAIAQRLLPAEVDQEDTTLSRAVEAVKAATFEVVGKAFCQSAQVSRGGLSLGAVELPSLEVQDHPGLYILGEALDIDGACGGYNLGFAWLSGLMAARALS